MRVNVKELVGPRCITSEDGQRVYADVHAGLLAGEEVVLDFQGVTVFASPFFNFAVGQLYRDLDSEILNRRLHPINLTPTGGMVLQRVIKNSRDYYADAAHRRAVDAAVRDLAETA